MTAIDETSPEDFISRKSMFLYERERISAGEIETDGLDARDGNQPLVVGLTNVLEEGNHIDIRSSSGKDGSWSFVSSLEEGGERSIGENQRRLVDLDLLGAESSDVDHELAIDRKELLEKSQALDANGAWKFKGAKINHGDWAHDDRRGLLSERRNTALDIG